MDILKWVEAYASRIDTDTKRSFIIKHSRRYLMCSGRIRVVESVNVFNISAEAQERCQERERNSHRWLYERHPNGDDDCRSILGTAGAFETMRWFQASSTRAISR